MAYLSADDKREYQRRWMAARRDEWIRENGPCLCGSWENLEVDHKDRTKKLYAVSVLWSMAKTNPKRVTELAKCQVLCGDCHAKKTNSEVSVPKGVCKYGHLLVPGNIYVHPKSKRRECLFCKQERKRLG